MITLAKVRKITARLPGTEEGPCYGTPGFRVKRKLFARMLEDGKSLVLKIDFDSRMKRPFRAHSTASSIDSASMMW